jgi:hypothetical protein
MAIYETTRVEVTIASRSTDAAGCVMGRSVSCTRTKGLISLVPLSITEIDSVKFRAYSSTLCIS